jgi:hypothetical protein
MRYLDYLKRFTFTPNEFYDHLKGMEDAAGGDLELVVLPAMTGESSNQPALKPTVSEANSTENPYVATVAVKLMNKANDKVLEWFNGTRKVTVDISSTAGTIAIDDEDAGSAGADATFDLFFENGVGTFIITLGGTWEAEDTIKVNADKDDSNNSVGIMGYTVKVENHFLIEVAADSQQEE